MRAISCLIAFILLFLAVTSNSQVAFSATQSLSASNLPLTIDQTQEFEVGVSLSCSGCTSDSYLRGVFYPSGTSYFGYTQDNIGNWSNAAGGSCTTYFKVVQSDLSKDGTWSGKLKIKPDKESSYYNGPGEYLFKVGRYTPSCSSPSVWSAETTIAITGPTSTPTPSETQALTNTPTSAPTSTNTPTPIELSLTPTKKISPSPTPKKDNSQSSSPAVLGTKVKDNPTNKSRPADTQVLSANDNSLIPKFLIATGIVFIMLCAIVICYPYIKRLIRRDIDE